MPSKLTNTQRAREKKMINAAHAKKLALGTAAAATVATAAVVARNAAARRIARATRSFTARRTAARSAATRKAFLNSFSSTGAHGLHGNIGRAFNANADNVTGDEEANASRNRNIVVRRQITTLIPSARNVVATAVRADAYRLNAASRPIQRLARARSAKKKLTALRSARNAASHTRSRTIGLSTSAAAAKSAAKSAAAAEAARNAAAAIQFELRMPNARNVVSTAARADFYRLNAASRPIQRLVRVRSAKKKHAVLKSARNAARNAAARNAAARNAAARNTRQASEFLTRSSSRRTGEVASINRSTRNVIPLPAALAIASVRRAATNAILKNAAQKASKKASKKAYKARKTAANKAAKRNAAETHSKLLNRKTRSANGNTSRRPSLSEFEKRDKKRMLM